MTRKPSEYATSIHGVSHAMGASGAANCWDCHGSHEILPAKNADSPVFKLNLPRTCATCHTNAGLTKEYQMKYPEVAAQYLDSIHGRALLKMGLIVAPSCNDCHGVHDIKRAVDRDAPINHANVAKTCGKCHVGIEQIYDQSVHGQLAGQRRQARPGLHRLPHRPPDRSPQERPLQDGQRRSAAASATQDRLEHYRETYHGKAMALGKPNVASEVAACYDCHGHHDVLPASNPGVAPLQGQHPRHLPAVPSRAPPPSSPNTSPTPTRSTARTIPLLHATFLGMTALLVGVFVFFGAHTAVVAVPVASTSTGTTRRSSARPRSAPRKAANGSPASCPSSGSSISWS